MKIPALSAGLLLCGCHTITQIHLLVLSYQKTGFKNIPRIISHGNGRDLERHR